MGISTIGGHADKRQPSEGELLQRAPLFHVRLSSFLGTGTSLTDQLTDTSTPTLTSKQLIGREGLRTFLGLRVVFLRALRFPPNLSFKTIQNKRFSLQSFLSFQ